MLTAGVSKVISSKVSSIITNIAFQIVGNVKSLAFFARLSRAQPGTVTKT